MNETTNALALAQEKIRLIDSLTNTLAPESMLGLRERNECAYLIHTICEADYIGTEEYRKVQAYQIASKADLFVKV